MEKSYFKKTLFIIYLSMPFVSFAQGEYITIPNYSQDVEYSKQWRVVESRYYDSGACANWLHNLGYTTYGEVGEWQRPPSTKDFGTNTYSIIDESCSYEAGHGYGYLEHYERTHYFRELSGKVYRYVEEDGKEYCVLDFNLAETYAFADHFLIRTDRQGIQIGNFSGPLLRILYVKRRDHAVLQVSPADFFSFFVQQSDRCITS